MKRISFETLKDLNPRNEGLSEAEVASQRSRHGKNEIVEVTNNPWIELALDTLKDPMIWFLLGIGTVFIFVGDTSEAIVLFVAILPLLLMDAILHWRTQASTSSLKGQLTSQVNALRAGKEVLVASHDLVPGDLILVNPGLYLPADGIFQEVKDLQVDESALTGEAFPISKSISRLEPFSLSGKGEMAVDPSSLGFAGTRVLTGLGKLRVLYTGQRTAYGEIVQSVSKMPHERTPLQKSITKLVQGLIVASAFLCLLLGGVRIYQGHGWLDALLSAATLAVAAIPEEFPVVFTFFLGVGVYRLAKRRALVRRAVSVENIGRVTHICTDKTGTITIGILQLTHMDPADGFAEVDLLKAAFAASNPDGSDPVDVAIREAANLQKLLTQIRTRTFPFTEDRKQETAFARTKDGGNFAYMKGSPETVLAKSNLSEEVRQQWKERTIRWASEGHKVLACAQKKLSEEEAARNEEPPSGFEFCGLIAFEDPPRPEVAEAMAYCQRNGIGVLMITGDHLDTAVAIARDVGLGGQSPCAVSAEDEQEKFQEQWLNNNPDFLRHLHVVARCTPLQKLHIVSALKTSGELVAVTGDGVNDVPALKAADIGIAMGERGTRSAKEVASIVLADDNFRTIVGAIKEGRQLFTNLGLSFKYLLYVHFPFVLTAAVIPLLGYPLVYLPVHIVWLELIIHPSALFAFQQPADGVDGIGQSKKSFFNRADIIEVIVFGIALTAIMGFSFVSGLSENVEEGHARAKAMVMLTFWSAGTVAAFSRFKTLASVLIVICTLLSTVLLVQIPFSAELLKLAPLHLLDWAAICFWVALFLTLQLARNFVISRRSSRND
ncbi:MAG: cation-transporting P-type ATPase [Bdellovibrionaceae bacterium]|nr:cation-transporting P-type ATPase [Pseudobdellovibrionaceae bacterium]